MTATRITKQDLGATVLSASFVFGEVPTGTIDGTNAAFVCSVTPTAGSVRVYKNGIRQDGGAYTFATDTITFLTSNIPLAGDVLLVDYLK